MKKIVATMLLAFLCFNGSTGKAAAYEIPGTLEAGVSSTIASVQNELDALGLEINELAGRVEAAKPTGTREEQQKQFFSLSMEIEQIDDKIDALEDRLHADYTSGTFTWEEYRTIERKLDALEDILDRADDLLERNFGMDD